MLLFWFKNRWFFVVVVVAGDKVPNSLQLCVYTIVVCCFGVARALV